MRIKLHKWPYAALMFWAAVLLYRAPFYASNLETVPDSVEYVTVGWRAAREGKITLPIEGQEMPPRYQPWFSLVVLTPLYLLPRTQPGDGIWAVYFLALLGVSCSIRMARSLAGLGAAIAATVLLLVMTDYGTWARKILTDAPTTALLLALASHYIEGEHPETSRWRMPLQAALLTLVTLWRPMLLLFAMPFVCDAWRKRARVRLVAYIALLLLATTVMMGYNAITFGHPLRNGYVFWCADAYGLGKGTFSIAHFIPNLLRLLKNRAGWLWVLAAIGFVLPSVRKAWRENGETRRLLSFLVLGGIPFAAVHLLYFFPDTRFFLPISALCAITGGIHIAAIGRVLSEHWMKWSVVGLLAVTIVWRLAWYRPVPPPRRLSADAIRSHTPARAIVISAIDPVYLWLMANGDSHRTFVPISRNVEYASKTIQLGWLGTDHDNVQAPGVQYVAAEQVQDLQDRVRMGIPVFVDTRLADDYGLTRQFETFMQNFDRVNVAEHLWKLVGTLPREAQPK